MDMNIVHENSSMTQQDLPIPSETHVSEPLHDALQVCNHYKYLQTNY